MRPYYVLASIVLTTCKLIGQSIILPTGLPPGSANDDRAIIQGALTGALPGATIELAPGTFEIGFSGTSPHLSLENKSSVTLKGAPNGATTLRFHGFTNVGLRLRNCSNCKVEDFVVDYATKPYALGTLAGWGTSLGDFSSGANASFVYIDLDLATSPNPLVAYPQPSLTSLASILCFDGNGTIRPGHEEFTVTAVAQDQTAGGGPAQGLQRFRFQTKNSIPTYSYQLFVGDVATYRMRGGYTMLGDDVANCSWKRVCVRSSPLVAFCNNRSSGVVYEECIVAPASASSPLSSNRGGIRNFACLEPGPIVSECTLERNGDDGVSIHSAWWEVHENVSGGNIFTVRTNHGTLTPVHVGSFIQMNGPATIRLHDGTTFARNGPDLHISAVTLLDGSPTLATAKTYRINLVAGETISAAAGDRIALLDYVGEGFSITGNTISKNRARGVILRSSFGTVSSNVIDGSTFAGISVGPDDDNEGPFSEGVMISNNLVSNTGFSRNVASTTATQLGAICVQFEHSQATWPNNTENSAITIENNNIQGSGHCGVFLGSVRDSFVRGNSFVKSQQTFEPAAGSAVGVASLEGVIQAQGCSNVFLEANRFDAPCQGSVIRPFLPSSNFVSAGNNETLLEVGFETTPPDSWPTSSTGYYNMAGMWTKPLSGCAGPMIPTVFEFDDWGLLSNPTFGGMVGLQGSRCQRSEGTMMVTVRSAKEVRFGLTFNSLQASTPATSCIVEKSVGSGPWMNLATMGNSAPFAFAPLGTLKPMVVPVNEQGTVTIRWRRTGPENASPYVYVDNVVIVLDAQ